MTPDEQAREAVRTFLREIWDTAQRNPKGKYDAQLDISIVLARLRDLGWGEDALYYAKDARWLRNEWTKCEAERDALRAQNVRLQDDFISGADAYNEAYKDIIEAMTGNAAVNVGAMRMHMGDMDPEGWQVLPNAEKRRAIRTFKAAITAALSVAYGPVAAKPLAYGEARSVDGNAKGER